MCVLCRFDARTRRAPEAGPDRIRPMFWFGVLSSACAVIMAGQAPAPPARDVAAVVREARQQASAGKLESAQQSPGAARGTEAGRIRGAARARRGSRGQRRSRRPPPPCTSAPCAPARRAPSAHDKLGFVLGRLDRDRRSARRVRASGRSSIRLCSIAQYHLGATRWWTRDLAGAESAARGRAHLAAHTPRPAITSASRSASSDGSTTRSRSSAKPSGWHRDSRPHTCSSAWRCRTGEISTAPSSTSGAPARSMRIGGDPQQPRAGPDAAGRRHGSASASSRR